MTTKSVPARGRRSKPAKTRKDFPLFPHASGQWAKKVRGKLHYFGVWDDPVSAELKWEREKQALLEGRDPNLATHGDSLGWLCNAFMESKNLQRERGELSQRAFNDYHRVCKEIAAFFGKSRLLESLRSNDFERYRSQLSPTWGPTTVNNHLRLARVLFKFANDIEATDRGIRYQIGLKSVPKSVVRKHDAKKPAKEFTAAEVHALLDGAGVPMKAFILLGINCAYGPMDIARLKKADIDFKGRWLGEPRGKTGVSRGAWLWPETIAALHEAIEARPMTRNPKLDELAFLTRNRRPWAEDGSESHPFTQAFRKLRLAVGIDRTWVGHYALRHTFETVGSDARDQQALDYIMGHYDRSMAGLYREGIDPKRVKAVCQHVRKWFLAGKPKKKRGGGRTADGAKGEAK